MSNQALTADKEAIQLIEKLNLDNIITPSETNPEELLARQSTRKGVPRPPNAFMLFKSSIYREVQCKGLPREMRVITKAASLLWNKMDNGAKDQYRKLAVKVSVLHAQRNPEFRYNPIRRNRATFSAFPTKRRASGRRTDDVRHAQQAQQQTQQQTQQETQQQHNHLQQQQQQQQVHYHQHSSHHSPYHHQHYHQHQQQQQQQQLQLHHQQQQRQQQTQREPFQSPSNYITELQTQASMLYAASSSPLMIPVPHHVPSLSLHPPLPSPTPSLPSPSSPDKVLAQPQYGQQQPSPQPFASSPQELLVVAGLPSPAQQTLVEPQPLQEFVMSQPILEASPPFNYSFLASEGLGISETSDIGSFDLYSY